MGYQVVTFMKLVWFHDSVYEDMCVCVLPPSD